MVDWSSEIELEYVLIKIFFNVTKMLFKCYYGFICIAGLLKLCCSQQKNTQEISISNSVIGKKFVVYFVESPSSKKESDTWLCGGALVSPTQILTAAACLVATEKIYAIAGYKKYIDSKDIEIDECTKARKQRVVSILIPTEYKSPQARTMPSVNVDVGVAIVEKPYNFSDLTYRVHCSYEPQPVFVNFENKYELASTHAVSFGWANINTQTSKDTKTHLLQEASTVLVDKKVCSKTVNAQEFVNIIEKYLLCASNDMNYERGATRIETKATKDCKVRRFDLYKAMDNDGCLEDDFGFRKQIDITNITNIDLNIEDKPHRIDTEIKNGSKEDYLTTTVNSRKTTSFLGPCQNGHGCPLIKWIGDKEIVIGIASSANKNNDCKGPFLYVSTAATSKIIKCLLETNSVTRKFCNEEISDKRYVVQEIEINWPDRLQKPHMPVLPVKRAVSDDQPLVPRPTRDIYIVHRASKDIDTKPYQQETVQNDQNQGGSHQFDRALRYSNPSYQRSPELLRMGPQQGQQYMPSEQPPDALLNQQYAQPPSQQYGSQVDQQYEIPPGQYETQPAQEYGPPPGQQYYPQLRQPYESSQQFQQQPEQQPEQQLGQQVAQQPGQQPAEQPGQQLGEQPGQQYGQGYEPPSGQDYSQPSDQAFDPHTGQPYKPPPMDQQYDPQTGQPYELPPGQQYELPPGQQFESPPNPYGSQSGQQSRQQYESLQNQQNMPPSAQEYEPPAKQGKSSNHQLSSPQFQSSDSPMREQYDAPPNQQYQPTGGQYENQEPPRQYEQQGEQQKPAISSEYQQQPRQQQPIMHRYETPENQQYNEPSRQSLGQSQGQLISRLQDLPPPESQNQSTSDQTTIRPVALFNTELQQPQSNDPEFNKVSTVKQQSQEENDPNTTEQSIKSFDQIFSQLHDLPNESPPQSNAPGHEETFEQLYSRLHEPSFELPHELNVPQYSGPPDEPYEETEHQVTDGISNRQADEPSQGSEQATPRSDNVRMRPQMPIDYQNDYFFYSYRRNGSDS